MNELNRELTPQEAAAMYHFHDRYGAQNLGAIGFYRTLTTREKGFIEDMVKAILRATKAEGRS